MFAELIATSLPAAPIAIDRSPAASAGASFTTVTHDGNAVARCFHLVNELEFVGGQRFCLHFSAAHFHGPRGGPLTNGRRLSWQVHGCLRRAGLPLLRALLRACGLQGLSQPSRAIVFHNVQRAEAFRLGEFFHLPCCGSPRRFQPTMCDGLREWLSLRQSPLRPLPVSSSNCVGFDSTTFAFFGDGNYRAGYRVTRILFRGKRRRKAGRLRPHPARGIIRVTESSPVVSVPGFIEHQTR